MCKYCNDSKDLIELNDDEYIWVFVAKNKLLVEAGTGSGGVTLGKESINYCPMCGRKLGEVQHEQ